LARVGGPARTAPLRALSRTCLRLRRLSPREFRHLRAVGRFHPAALCDDPRPWEGGRGAGVDLACFRFFARKCLPAAFTLSATSRRDAPTRHPDFCTYTEVFAEIERITRVACAPGAVTAGRAGLTLRSDKGCPTCWRPSALCGARVEARGFVGAPQKIFSTDLRPLEHMLGGRGGPCT